MKRFVCLFVLAAVIISLFAFTSSKSASAHPAYVRGKCWSATCDDRDPTRMQCLTNVFYHPYKQPETYNGVVVGYITSVYSYNCNSNWDEAELTSDATSQGWSIRTSIRVIDMITTATRDLRNRGNVGIPEVVDYPAGNATDGTTANGVVSNNAFGLLAYNGATGWPTASNMVDGTNTTHSEFMIFDGSGNRVIDDTTIQQ